MVLHWFLAEYFEPLIVYIFSFPGYIFSFPGYIFSFPGYIFSFPVDILLWQSSQHRKSNNDVFSILSHQLCVLFPPLGVLVAVSDGCTVDITWELLSLLWDARGLDSESGMWCKRNARHCKLSSPRVLILVSRLVIHEVPGGCARTTLGHFVCVNQQNAEYESKVSYLTSWTKKSPELEYLYPFFPPTPSFSFPPVFYTPPASRTI